MAEQEKVGCEARVVRRYPAPLVMKKTRLVREDGRALIYYEFLRPAPRQGEVDPEAIHLIPGTPDVAQPPVEQENASTDAHD